MLIQPGVHADQREYRLRKSRQKGKEALSNMGNECDVLLRADQREYRSRKSRKKEKKARKGRGEDEVSAAFKEAALSADAEQRRRTQSETLEALFEIFFRALKHCTATGLAAASHRGVLLPPASMLSGRICRKYGIISLSCVVTSQKPRLCFQALHRLWPPRRVTLWCAGRPCFSVFWEET